MKIKFPHVSVLLVLFAGLHQAAAQGTAFTYQGQLSSGGSPANGLYDFRFKLNSDALGDFPVTGYVFSNAVPVSNGLFTATINFGAGLFTGTNYWLDVEVRTNNPANNLSYNALTPLQPLTPVPYAMFANSASNLSGTLTAANLSGTFGGALTLNNSANSFSGSYSGNGANVTNVNAAALGGLSAANFWQLGGNNVGAGQFLGSTNSNPVELWVSGSRALRLEPGGVYGPNVIGGYSNNFVSPGIYNATIAGGGQPGSTNRVTAGGGTVGGGNNNASSNYNATVSGGANNTAAGNASSVGGGSENGANGDHDSIAGGQGNLISALADHAFIGGGGGGFSGNAIEDGASAAVIGGGGGDSIQTNANNSFIGGGVDNTIEPNSYEGTIGGGWTNTLQANNYQSTIGGGSHNMIQFNAYLSVISGGSQNTITTNSQAAVIGGGSQNTNGGELGTIGGGYQNTNGGYISTIGGGEANEIQTEADHSTIGGGGNNTIVGSAAVAVYSTIAGGMSNIIPTNAIYSVIGGGLGNTNAGSYATIPGGYENVATGSNSFAAGALAQATNNGAFVWADSEGAVFSSTNTNTFNVRANGGVVFVTSGGGMTLDGQNVLTASSSLNALRLSGTVPLAQLSGITSSQLSAATWQLATNLNGGLAAMASNVLFGLTISNPIITNALITNSAYGGNGGGLTNVNALSLNGFNSTNFWQLGGNNVASTQFLGSTNNQPVQIMANGGRVLRLEPGGASSFVANGVPTGAPNVIGGSPFNFVTSGVVGATVAGGGATNYSGGGKYTNSVTADFGTVGGGAVNSVTGQYGVTGGGLANTNTGYIATVAGGAYNSATSGEAVVAGGNNNVASGSGSFIGGGGNDGVNFNGGNLAAGAASVISGGYGNQITVGATYATIPGGVHNLAEGEYSFAAGQFAQALNQGAFVWADSQNAGFASTANDQFLVRAQGGVGFTTGNLTVTTGAGTLSIENDQGAVPGILASGGAVSGHARFRNALEIWPNTALTSAGYLDVRSTNGNTITISLTGATGAIVCSNVTASGVLYTSDRNAKEGFTPVRAQAVLDKVAALPITEWNYKTDASGVRHLGPMAQDFQAAFQLNGSDDKHISVVDEGGVALAAIQGLNHKVESENSALRAENAELKQRLDALEKIVLGQNPK